MKSIKPKKLTAIDLLINSASLQPAISQNDVASRNAVANLSDGIPVEISPEICRPWKLADRPLSEMEHKAELIESFQRDNIGQLQPIIVRPVNDPEEPNIVYEVISGRVRWMAAKELGMPVQAVVRNLTDQEAYVVMSVENRQRKNISDWARAKSYQRALQMNIFESAQALAGIEGISKSTLSFYLGFAELPDPVVKVFNNISSISYRMGYAIAKACKSQGVEAIVPLIPGIESGELGRQDIESLQVQVVALSQIPSETSEVSELKPVDADAETAEQEVYNFDVKTVTPSTDASSESTDNRTYSELPKKVFVSATGRKLFTYNQASRGWLIRLNPEFSGHIDESAILSIGGFIENLLGQSKS